MADQKQTVQLSDLVWALALSMNMTLLLLAFTSCIAVLVIMVRKVIDLYTIFDSARRQVAEMWLKHKSIPLMCQTNVSQGLLSESNFIKGSGFRMHRLLHENRVPAFTDGEAGKTILAPAFKQSPMKRVTSCGLPTMASHGTTNSRAKIS